MKMKYDVVPDFILSAWMLRRAALTGREADGRNPMALPFVPASDTLSGIGGSFGWESMSCYISRKHTLRRVGAQQFCGPAKSKCGCPIFRDIPGSVSRCVYIPTWTNSRGMAANCV
jgi:hypothetical protein